jgi:hypothetical protein
MAEKKNERRRYLRYPPDPTEIVQVQFSGGQEGFRPELAALPSEESRGGLRLVALHREPIEGVREGTACIVKVASLGPQRAQVRWIDADDDEVVRFGVQFTEE